MNRQNLTPNIKRRFDRNHTCPICGKVIEDYDNIVVTVRKIRRCKQYIFTHEECFVNEEKIKEKEKCCI